MTGSEGNGSAAGAAAERQRAGELALDTIRQEKLRWVELYYTDLLGGYNHIHIPAAEIGPEAFSQGLPKLDGSSV
ncbi:MAG: hypothetical protein ACYDFT_03375, partial [Thermoplasmata archaeon]